MQIETRNLGVSEAHLDEEVQHALSPALDRFEPRIRRVRVRFVPAGSHGATCRMRAWCGAGPTIVVEERADTAGEAVRAAAETLNRTLARHLAARRHRMRHASSEEPS